MKIILVVTDSRGRNLVFVSDALQTYSLEKAITLARAGTLKNIYAVKRTSGVYLRSRPSVAKKEQLDQRSISSNLLFSSMNNIHHALSTPALSSYWGIYQHSLEQSDGPFIMIDGYPRITEEVARMKLYPHRDLIFAAAKRFDIDPYLLGATIIDEIARLNPFEEILEKLAVHFVGKNTSAGIAQVKMDTARGLIQSGYYNPNPDDHKLSPKEISKIPRAYLHKYVKESKHSIYFAAARMRELIDEWKKLVDLSKRPEIIATLYHLPHRYPHAHPQANNRGLQIVKDFYPLAKGWLP